MILFEKKDNIFWHLASDIIFDLTGLRCSAGIIAIPDDRLGYRSKGAIFVDGRYIHAARSTVDLDKFDIVDRSSKAVIEWLKENMAKDESLYYDSSYFSIADFRFYSDCLKKPLRPLTFLGKGRGLANPSLYELADDRDKIGFTLDFMADHDLDAYLFCDPCSISWLLNVRDLSVRYTPVLFSYLLLTRGGEIGLHMPEGYACDIGHPRISEADLRSIGANRVGMDSAITPCKFMSESTVILEDPIVSMRSIKSKEEIEDIRRAALWDSIAFIKLIDWFYEHGPSIGELDIVEQLELFRRENDRYIGKSFSTIAAADANASIIHYSPTRNTIIRNLLLLDAGGQYKNGTTDITRTVAFHDPSDREKFAYTLVLKSHIALASARFPEGTTGAQLDRIAREVLTKHGMDYKHGTGHGIGYLSEVHEGRVSISSKCEGVIEEGMILSNEPGFYEDNVFGIRLENMMLTRKARDGLLEFETISLVPFDYKFILTDMLTSFEVNWLNEYHRKIFEQISSVRGITSFV